MVQASGTEAFHVDTYILVAKLAEVLVDLLKQEGLTELIDLVQRHLDTGHIPRVLSNPEGRKTAVPQELLGSVNTG